MSKVAELRLQLRKQGDELSEAKDEIRKLKWSLRRKDSTRTLPHSSSTTSRLRISKSGSRASLLSRANSTVSRGSLNRVAFGRGSSRRSLSAVDEEVDDSASNVSDSTGVLPRGDALLVENKLLGQVITGLRNDNKTLSKNLATAEAELGRVQIDEKKYRTMANELKEVVVDLDTELKETRWIRAQWRAKADKNTTEIVNRWRAEVQQLHLQHAEQQQELQEKLDKANHKLFAIQQEMDDKSVHEVIKELHDLREQKLLHVAERESLLQRCHQAEEQQSRLYNEHWATLERLKEAEVELDRYRQQLRSAETLFDQRDYAQRLRRAQRFEEQNLGQVPTWHTKQQSAPTRQRARRSHRVPTKDALQRDPRLNSAQQATSSLMDVLAGGARSGGTTQGVADEISLIVNTTLQEQSLEQHASALSASASSSVSKGDRGPQARTRQQRVSLGVHGDERDADDQDRSLGDLSTDEAVKAAVGGVQRMHSQAVASELLEEELRKEREANERLRARLELSHSMEDKTRQKYLELVKKHVHFAQKVRVQGANA